MDETRNGYRAAPAWDQGGVLTQPCAPEELLVPLDVRPRRRPRPTVRGKFLARGDEKLYVRGATYGTFRPDATGAQFPDPLQVERDFALMALHGMNAVRTYTVPPRWLLDVAEERGLLVMVGLPWEQHVAFLDDRERVRSIERRVREGVRSCGEHPAVLAYAVGNEIPAPIARWHGPRRIEGMLERLYTAAKEEDPEGLVTYVNFPSTEYLELPFVDFASFNVYLEAERTLRGYLARLHNLAEDKPLLMAEIGLDSRRNGADTQARVLDWQVRTAFESGCAGAFLFAWTDEWYRGGFEIDDWDFGLTDRARRPKPALAAAKRAFERTPIDTDAVELPRMTVAVCSYNGATTIAQCLDGLSGLDYPDYEVVVVSDGSTDATADIARKYDCVLIETENRGLSSARNTALEAATGEVIAYIDDDAWPDPHWLHYLGTAFASTDHAAIGGPNLPPPGATDTAQCVANAPGSPTHVLVADTVAEHIPGCNSAYRRSALLAIGGFDTQFRIAGDDVDVCWRLQEAGRTIGFNPAAVVWHHRRRSVRAYLRQQRGYGRAEGLLAKKWPERYNGVGHLRWGGRIYGQGVSRPLRARRSRVAYGTWGTRLFQSVYEPADGRLSSITLMPEWYLLITALAAIGGLGAVWQPLLLSLPLIALAVAAPFVQAVRAARRAVFDPPGRRAPLRRALTAFLHLAQPLARLAGRVEHGLAPWRRWAPRPLALPRPRAAELWSETWRAPEEQLGAIERDLIASGAAVRRGGEFDRWDLEVCGGMLARVRLFTAVEEHGSGKQLTRVRSWPSPSLVAAWLIGPPSALAVVAALTGATGAAVVLAAVALVLALGAVAEAMAATGEVVRLHRGEPARRRARGRALADSRRSAGG
jgi:GT2 family glycosyltransferase